MPSQQPALCVAPDALGFGDVLHASVTGTLAFLVLPLREWFIRWRRTGFHVALYLLITIELTVLGAPWLLSLVIAVPLLLASMVCALAIIIRFRTDDIWLARDGRDAALVLCDRDRRHGGHRVHAWASWRHGRGLGAAVAHDAIAQAPRPLWVMAATPELRSLYEHQGAQPDPAGSHWMFFTAEGSRECQNRA